MSSYRSRLYRSRDKIVFGVCQGFADWTGIGVGSIRLIIIILTIITGFFPFGLVYLAAAFFLPLTPVRRRYSDRTYRRDSYYSNERY